MNKAVWARRFRMGMGPMAWWMEEMMESWTSKGKWRMGWVAMWPLAAIGALGVPGVAIERLGFAWGRRGGSVARWGARTLGVAGFALALPAWPFRATRRRRLAARRREQDWIVEHAGKLGRLLEFGLVEDFEEFLSVFGRGPLRGSTVAGTAPRGARSGAFAESIALRHGHPELSSTLREARERGLKKRGS